MSHPDENELVMYLLGDAGDRQRLGEHVAGCDRCSRQIEEVRQLLAATESMPVPEPDSRFEQRIWDFQRKHLGQPADRVADDDAETEQRAQGGTVIPFWSGRRLAMVGAVAAMLLVAFLAGLYTGGPAGDTAADRDGIDRVLLIAVGDHLASARMVLAEVVNADQASSPDLAVQQERAAGLLVDNRLYRQSAELGGQASVAAVLDDLERVLIEIARSPQTLSADDVEWLRQRIESKDLLFKVSVIEGQARAQMGIGIPVGDAL